MTIKLLSGGGSGRRGFLGSSSGGAVPDNLAWQPVATTTIRVWKKVAMTRDGHYQVAAVKSGTLYYSHDYGKTWTAATLAPVLTGDWMSVCCSYTGNYFYAAAMLGTVGIYKSTDYGVNWTQIYTDGDNSLVDLACSSTGRYLLTAKSSGAVTQNRVSADYGATWTNSFPTTYNMRCAVSATGQTMFLCRHTGVIYKNTNYGNSASWDAGTTIDATASLIERLRCSGNAQYLMVYLGGKQLYNSSDGGATWVNRGFILINGGSSDPGGDIQLSSDGKIQAVVGSSITNNQGFLWVSDDYGVSWKWFFPNMAEYTIDFSDNFRYVTRPERGVGSGIIYGIILIRK